MKRLYYDGSIGFHQMNMPYLSRVSLLALGFTATIVLTEPQLAQAGAVISNNADPALRTVVLGVNDAGHLNFQDGSFRPANTSFTGLSYLFADGTWRDATSPGCLCEGWGVAVTSGGSRTSGFVNESSGSGGLTGGMFGSTTTTATSTISLAGAPLKITHAYGVSLAPNIFQGNVTLTNTGTETLEDVVYRRAMDWDVPPTEFSEYVSHYGVASNLESMGGNIRYASDNGFASSDPQEPAGSIDFSTINTDFVQSGPNDHGSVFDFSFGSLAPGASRIFNIFYGAAATLQAAKDSIAKLNPTVWSFGQSTIGGGDGGGHGGGDGGGDIEIMPPFEKGGEEVAPVAELLATTSDAGVESASSIITAPADDKPTYIFAFGGVGGVEPGTTPDNPVLPFVPAPGEFSFPAPEPRRWYDPPFTSSTEYSLGTGSFLSFIVPPGFTTIDLVVDGVTLKTDLEPSKEYRFLEDFGITSVTRFTLVGIEPFVDMADATAFPTFLDMTSGSTGLMMKGSPVASVPGPLPMLGAGTALAVSRKLRRRIRRRATCIA